jgi:tRNA (uracil-5-)-methyltransferase TRM9
MKDETIQRLNAINTAFYATTAEQFDLLRRGAWPGWKRLLTYLPQTDQPLTVLDVGCGNGRFAVFLAKSLARPIVYHGQDNSPHLLDHARLMTQNVAGLEATFEQRDILEQPPNNGHYDLVVLFGVIHHIPDFTHRLDLMRTLATRLNPNALLAFACWRFFEYERYREKLVEWPTDLEREQHDYLLDWRRGTHALRYCHYVDDNEHAQLVSATGLSEIATYRADGDAGNVNRYSILINKATLA